MGFEPPPKFRFVCKISIRLGVIMLILQTFHIQTDLGPPPKEILSMCLTLTDTLSFGYFEWCFALPLSCR